MVVLDIIKIYTEKPSQAKKIEESKIYINESLTSKRNSPNELIVLILISSQEAAWSLL